MAFVGQTFFSLCYTVLSCAFPGVPVCYREFAMQLNWPLSDIICKLLAILCIFYGLELAFVAYSLILCVLNVIA